MPRFAVALSALLLFAAAGGVRAEEPLQAVLDRAESVRSTDSRLFSELLEQADGRLAEASPRQRAQLRYLRVYELGFMGRFDAATREATALFNDVDDPDIKLRAGALIVNSHAATRNFPEGLRYLDKTLELIDRVADPELRSHGWFAASSLYTQIGQYELARHFADRVLETSTSPRSRCFAGQQRLEAQYQLYVSRGPGIEASLPRDDEISGVIDGCAAAGEKLVVNFARILQARVWELQDRQPEALALMRDHLADAEATNYPRMIGEAHALLGHLYLGIDDLGRAEAHAREAVARGTDMAFSLPLVQAHETLYRAALARGDVTAALAHHERYAAADKAYLDAVQARELAFQMVRQETAQKTQQIDLLNNQNRVLQLEQRVAQQAARQTQLLAVFLTAMLAFLGFWAWKTKKMQVSLKRIAETDMLTGVSNRHHFVRCAEETLQQARRSGHTVALVMFDLDEFKAINDRFGHATGDWVLQKVAEACQGLCRRGDLFGRLGGEEFAFLLLGAENESGIEMAERCRERFAAIETGVTGRTFRITASFGVTDSVHAGLEFHPLLAQADEAMYRAKHGGRDRIAVQPPSPVAETA